MRPLRGGSARDDDFGGGLPLRVATRPSVNASATRSGPPAPPFLPLPLLPLIPSCPCRRRVVLHPPPSHARVRRGRVVAARVSPEARGGGTPAHCVSAHDGRGFRGWRRRDPRAETSAPRGGAAGPRRRGRRGVDAVACCALISARRGVRAFVPDAPGCRGGAKNLPRGTSLREASLKFSVAPRDARRRAVGRPERDRRRRRAVYA